MQGTKWRVQISGDPSNLRALTRAFADGEVVITESGNAFYLTARDLDSLETAGAVRGQAEKIAASLSGSARLHLGSTTSISVGGIQKIVGSRIVFAESALVSVRASTLAAVPDSPEATGAADQMREWVEMARENAAVAKALRLRNADTLSWPDLSRILDVIRADTKEDDKARAAWLAWTTDAERSRFRRTANHPAASGDQARHGVSTRLPPANPMSLREGEKFLDDLLRKWLEYRAAARR